MVEKMERFENWDRKSLLVVRIDFGYKLPLTRGKIFDASFSSLKQILNHFEKSEQSPVTVLNSHYFFSLRRRNENLKEVLKIASENGSLFETRFYKYFRLIKKILTHTSTHFFAADIKSDGILPPLYKQIEKDEKQFINTLIYEWETGILTSRGSSVLIEIGEILSRSDKPKRLTDIANEMGITLGAVSSYLKWMEDASLIRREGKDFSLRHSGLKLLFKGNFKRSERKENFFVEID